MGGAAVRNQRIPIHTALRLSPPKMAAQGGAEAAPFSTSGSLSRQRERGGSRSLCRHFRRASPAFPKMAAPRATARGGAARASGFLGLRPGARDPADAARPRNRGSRSRKKGWKRWRGPEAALGRELDAFLHDVSAQQRLAGCGGGRGMGRGSPGPGGGRPGVERGWISGGAAPSDGRLPCQGAGGREAGREPVLRGHRER